MQLIGLVVSDKTRSYVTIQYSFKFNNLAFCIETTDIVIEFCNSQIFYMEENLFEKSYHFWIETDEAWK